MSSSDSGTPRWVKVFAIIGGLLVVLLVVVLLLGGNHGPTRHSSLGAAAIPTAADGHAG
jgi:hypothetical protein